jgi:hypothetical protein
MIPDWPSSNDTAAREGGVCVLGVPMWLLDTITQASAEQHRDCVLVTGSHAGLSVVRYAIAARPRLVVFNDAGVGRDGAGIAALPLLDAAGVGACAVAHTSARIGEAASTLADGRIVHSNNIARRLGTTPGRQLAAWLLSAPRAVPSPARR